MRSLAVFILSLALCGSAIAADGSGLKLAPNPEWCREGYRCLSISDYGEMTKIKVNLEEKLKVYKASSRHFGMGCAIGPTVGLAVDVDLHVHLVPSLGVTCGAAVKF